jgi:hypothetical protein
MGNQNFCIGNNSQTMWKMKSITFSWQIVFPLCGYLHCHTVSLCRRFKVFAPEFLFWAIFCTVLTIIFWKTFKVSDFWVQFRLKLVFLNIYCHFFNLINLGKNSLIYTSKKFMSNTKCKINRYGFQNFRLSKIEGNAWAQDSSQEVD